MKKRLKYMLAAFENGFDAAVSAWDSFKEDKHICDLLHCLKLARYRLLTGNITLNCDQIYHLMKDYYVLKLFNFVNLEKLFEKDLIYELVYFIPFTCWAEAVTNQNINCEIRIQLLRIAFDFLYQFFIQNTFEQRLKGITFNNSKNSIAKVFADDGFLIRSLNSIVGLASILMHYSEVGVDCIGTRVIENFLVKSVIVVVILIHGNT